jgi:uncharacterized protein (UPF0332 family)
MTEPVTNYLEKAAESLAGAESEYANGRYNNSANRCYYACFQAGIGALLAAGLRPAGTQWSHTFVQGRFIGELINRRKRYAASHRDTLPRVYDLRLMADYDDEPVTQTQALRALRRSRALVAAVLRGGDST